jgi:hypothetical protein
MIIPGSFGYKIGRKLRLMNVDDDADLLWQICVREIYVLMKNYGSIDLLREEFEKLVEVKNHNKPKQDALKKCEIFTDFQYKQNQDNQNQDNQNQDNNAVDWNILTRYCQHSFINILESGYFLNNGTEQSGLTFILDFNTNSVYFYRNMLNDKSQKQPQKPKQSQDIKYINEATIEELMEFDDMPTKTLKEILTEMNERYLRYKDKNEDIQKEMERIDNIIFKARELGNDQNIIEKAKKLKDDLEWTKREVNMEYRFFYNRLDALNLIDHSPK